MKIALVGGGTGGHFYPLIAVAEAIEDTCEEKRLLEPQLVYISPTVFDTEALFEHSIIYKPTSAGRVRRYASALNILDIFRTAFGIIRAIPQLFSVYPDVIFSTGGYAAFPVLVAARILAIPVIIYDADARPGRVSLWSAKFAKAIAVAHPEAASQFPEKVRHNIARTGHPIRKEILGVAKEGGYEFLHLDGAVPTVLFMGGSQGAKALNESVLDALPELLRAYNVVLQTGKAHID
ncbi:MAG TPA: glycosyltransferase, partial [Candidatus Paceibacterota bacterium]